MFKFFCLAANGPIKAAFRLENTHLALLNSVFRVSFSLNWSHFRLKQKKLNML
jgi:hypothetical protein